MVGEKVVQSKYARMVAAMQQGGDQLLGDLLAGQQQPQAEPVQTPQPPRQTPQPGKRDWSLRVAMLALWMAIAGFGLVWWGLNGSYSVLGLKVGAESFGPKAQLFYELIAAWQFTIPLKPALVEQFSLPVVQPVLPWIGVIATSLLQVTITYRRARGLPIPAWLSIAAFVLSGYDMVTTWYGLSEIDWIKAGGPLIHVPTTIILTFGLELLTGLLLGHKRK
jgi:hypothetical protein